MIKEKLKPLTQNDGSDAADHDPPEPPDGPHDAVARLEVHLHLLQGVQEVVDAEHVAHQDELGDRREQLRNWEIDQFESSHTNLIRFQ